MPWTTPVDQITGFLVPATVYNQQIIDNIAFLHAGLLGTTTVILNPTTSYSAPATATGLRVQATGGGGGGGGNVAAAAGQAAAGAGGGGGSMGLANLTTNLGTHTVAVGTGGPGGIAGAAGANGLLSSFKDSAATIVAQGDGAACGKTSGSVATGFSAGASGAQTGTGTLYAGSVGQQGLVFGPAAAMGGGGGAAGSGAGGGQPLLVAGNGINAIAGGGGGGGSLALAGNGAATGGNGGNGTILVVAYG